MTLRPIETTDDGSDIDKPEDEEEEEEHYEQKERQFEESNNKKRRLLPIKTSNEVIERAIDEEGIYVFL